MFGTSTGFKEPATSEEVRAFREEPDVLTKEFATQRRGFIEKVTEPILFRAGNINEQLKTGLTEPIGAVIGAASKKVGGPGSLEEARVNVIETSQFLESKGVPREFTRDAEFISGVGIGATSFVKDQPLAVGAAVGAGLVVGAITTGVGLAGASVGPTTSAVAQGGLSGGGLLLGGAFAVSTAQRFQAAPTTLGKGEIIGEVGVGLLAFGVGTKAGSRVTSGVFGPITRTEIVRPIKIAEAKEVSFRVIKGGREFDVGQFVIKGETRPPLRVTTTTRFREFIGAAPIKVEISPAKTFNIQTLGNVFKGRPFKVSEVRSGRRTADIINIQGTTKTFSTQEISSLTKTERFALQRLLEGKTGKPVSSKTAEPLLGKEAQLNKAFIESTKELRINPKTKEFELLPSGRRTIRFEAISRLKSVVQADKFEIINIRTEFKDVTFPFARAAGKTTRLKTELIRIEEPFLLDKAKPIGKKFFGGTKTPLSKTFQKEVTILESALPKPPLPTPEVLPSPVKTTTTITPTRTLFDLGSSKVFISEESVSVTPEFIITGRVINDASLNVGA